LRLTAFACIRYFRHELFVDAQSLVFKLLFPFCLPGSISWIDAKRKVSVTCPSRQDLAGTSELVRTQVVPAGVGSQPTALGRRATPPADVGEPLGSGQRVPGFSQNMDDDRCLCDDTAGRQS